MHIEQEFGKQTVFRYRKLQEWLYILLTMFFMEGIWLLFWRRDR
jgi:cbb3-type cytochrome oxidase subunit 3